MTSRELYSDIRSIAPIFIRLDGRAFHRLAHILNLARPFDERFSEAMCTVCQQLLKDSGLCGTLAFTFSDEISVYLPTLPFSGRVEKIDSVVASFAASALTISLELDEPVAFDARIVQAGGDVTKNYLIERQQEAWRNQMNAWCQQALINEGITPARAAEVLKGKTSPQLHEMMFARGINLAKTPAWQRRGIMVYRSAEERQGYDPMKEERVIVSRRVVTIDRDLPLFTTPEGQSYLASRIDKA